MKATPFFRPTVHVLALFACLLAFAALQGCAQLGLQPKTFNDKLLIATTAVDELQKTTTTLLNARKISSSDAENVLKTADGAVVGIGVARQIAVADPNAANAKLNAAIAVVAALQAYLATKGGGT